MTAFAAAYSAASGQTISWKPSSFSSVRVRCGVTPRSIMFATSGGGSCAAISLELLDGLRRLDEQRVGARLLVGEAALDRRVEAERLARVGAGDDEQVALAARVGGGADLGRVLLGGDHLLALEVAALLRPHLVLEEHAGRARVLEVADGAQHVDRVAVAGVGVDDHGRGRRRARRRASASAISDSVRKPKSGSPRCAARHRVAGDEDDVEADARGDARRERVVDARHQDGVVRDEVADLLGGRSVMGDPSLTCSGARRCAQCASVVASSVGRLVRREARRSRAPRPRPPT